VLSAGCRSPKQRVVQTHCTLGLACWVKVNEAGQLCHIQGNCDLQQYGKQPTKGMAYGDSLMSVLHASAAAHMPPVCAHLLLPVVATLAIALL
jgi:hypothetical protein